MRIGIISTGTLIDRMPPIFGGGIQKYIWNLARELAKKGHEVHIFTTLRPTQLKNENINNINIHRVSQYFRGGLFSTVIFGFEVFFKILRIQKTIGRFQILHAQSRISAFILRLFFPFKITFLFTSHNWDVALTIPGKFLPQGLYQLIFWIEKRMYKMSDRIIALTKTFQQVLVSRYKVPPHQVQVIPNLTGIPKQMIKDVKIPKFFQKIGGESYLIFVGRLESEKGLNFLVNAFPSLQSIENNLKLVIVGGGSLKSKILEMRNVLKLKNTLHLLGRIQENHLLYLLKKARALILPSEFEIMPTIVLESWAAGCPVIIRNYRGVDELIEHRKTGFIFKDTETLLSCVKDVVDNQALRQMVIDEAQQQLRSYYLASTVTERLLKEYQRLMGRGAS